MLPRLSAGRHPSGICVLRRTHEPPGRDALTSATRLIERVLKLHSFVAAGRANPASVARSPRWYQEYSEELARMLRHKGRWRPRTKALSIRKERSSRPTGLG